MKKSNEYQLSNKVNDSKVVVTSSEINKYAFNKSVKSVSIEKQINNEIVIEKSNKKDFNPLPPAHATTTATTTTSSYPHSSSDSDRIENLASEISLGFGEVNLENEYPSQTLVIRDGPESYKSILKTICAYAIRCSHGRMAVQKVKDHQGFWLPYVYASEFHKYLDTVNVLYDFWLNENKKFV